MHPLIKKNEQMEVTHFFSIGNEALQLKLIAGQSGLKNHAIGDRAINRPALALMGYTKSFAQKRLQYIGCCELSYLLDLESTDRLQKLEQIARIGVPCFVATDKIAIPQDIIQFFDQQALPLFVTSLSSAEFIEQATILLEEYFSPTTTLFGTLIEVNGLGVLIQGLPALNKSVCTVALIEKGHSLIADDVVCVSCGHNNTLIGKSKAIAHGFMEFRGIGLLKVTEHFGTHAVRSRSNIDLVVRFDESFSVEERTGLEAPSTCSILDHTLPLIQLPICSGNDAFRLVEIAVTLQLLRAKGDNPAEELTQRLLKHME